MSPELNNVYLKPGEREELERLFSYTDKLMEEVERDPEVGRRLLERIGFFEAVKDQEEEQAAHRGGHSKAESNGAS
jgi:hypothetical protein